MKKKKKRGVFVEKNKKKLMTCQIKFENGRVNHYPNSITSFSYSFLFKMATKLTKAQLNYQSYYWVGTWQDMSKDPKPCLDAKGKRINYIIYQAEQAPTTGKEHFQLYVEFYSRQRLKTLMRAFPHCYWSPRLGTARQAIDYCSKEESRISGPWSFGQPGLDVEEMPLVHTPDQPRKKVSGLQIACDALRKKEMNLAQLMEKNPAVFARHHSGLTKLASRFAKKRTTKPEVVVFYGLPESGKSRTAMETALSLFDESDIYRYSYLDVTGKEWWEGYLCESCVIIEEMNGQKFKFERLLELLDRYSMKIPCKGGSFEFVGQLIILTSNYPPSSWYENVMWTALKRRIDQTFRFVLVENETFASGRCVYEPQLDLNEMRHPDEFEHMLEMVRLNRERGFITPKRQEDQLIPDAHVTVMTNEEEGEEFF